jgi:rhodanese-related sulfurtransferase
MKKFTVIFGLLCAVMILPGSPAVGDDVCTPSAPSISTQEAYDNARDYSNAFILDIRTPDEWRWVGHPGPNKGDEDNAWLRDKVKQVSYILFPRGIKVTNPSFISDVDEIFEDYPDVEIYVLCRSGKRGIPATKALICAGYNAMNVEFGFEGPTDSKGHRSVDGWKIDGLPYNFDPKGRYLD